MLDVNAYELINKCSPFVIFDFIRSVVGETTARATTRHTTTDQGLQEPLPDTQQQINDCKSDYQTHNSRSTTARATTRHTTADREEWLHRTSSHHITESVK